METKENLINDLCAFFSYRTEFELIVLNNSYVEAVTNKGDFTVGDMIHYRDDFFGAVCEEMNPLDVINGLTPEFNCEHQFVRMSGECKITSTSNLGDWINKHKIIDFIIDNDDDLGDKEIRRILNENSVNDNDESEITNDFHTRMLNVILNPDFNDKTKWEMLWIMLKLSLDLKINTEYDDMLFAVLNSDLNDKTKLKVLREMLEKK